MTTESKKLQTTQDGLYALSFIVSDKVLHDLRIAHELMDSSRKTPETPLEKEQREVIRRLVGAGRHAENCTGAFDRPCNCGWESAIAAAAPYILED